MADLPRDAHLCVTLRMLSPSGERTVLGATSLPLFNSRGKLKAGLRALLVRTGREADAVDPSRVAGKLPAGPPCRCPPPGPGPAGGGGCRCPPPTAELAASAERLRVLRRVREGRVRPVPWLDPLVAPAVSLPASLAQHFSALLTACAGRGAGGGPPGRAAVEAMVGEGWMDRGGAVWVLLLELPALEADVLRFPAGARGGGAQRPAGAAGDGGAGGAGAAGAASDPMVLRDNLAEVKEQRLLRRGLAGESDVPDVADRAELERVLARPFQTEPLRPRERALLWRFRRRLTADARHLPSFLRSIDWGMPQEAAEALRLMGQWAPLGHAQALDLLGPDLRHPAVRARAVEVLAAAPDGDLLLFLPQLVQALRHEAAPAGGLGRSPLARFLVGRAVASPGLATALHWYLVPEWGDAALGEGFVSVYEALVERLGEAGDTGRAILEDISQQNELMMTLGQIVKELSALGTWGAGRNKGARLRALLGEGGEYAELAGMQARLPLEPRLLIRGLVAQDCSVFRSALSPLRLVFVVEDVDAAGAPGEGAGPGGGGARGASQDRRASQEARALRSVEPPAARRPPCRPAASRPAASSPASPSARSPPPLLEEEAGLEGGHPDLLGEGVLEPPIDPGGGGGGAVRRYVCIYKKGDDLRQDQLAVQMFRLMDGIFKKENLDLRLVSYRVIATSRDDGLVEFVESSALADILATDRSILRFLQKHNPDSRAEFNVAAPALDNFVRSCAGYCVMTYVLGVGDRHLDNLMVTRDGRLFHIDFGFILGKDPKPFPPPVKLCREMVEAMGGSGSPRYQHFQTLCCEAFDILRKSAPLVLTLVRLMEGSTIPDIASQPDATLKVMEKLHLELDAEGARAFMRNMLEESARALMPQVMETAHRWAQYWR